jgi:hypothetical protein
MDDPYDVARRIRLLLAAIPHKSDAELAVLATADEATVAKMRAKEAAEEQKIREWLAVRKEAASHIDPETAEVMCIYGNLFDPYGVRRLPPEHVCSARCHFARAPESNIWVSFDDLTDEARDRLDQRMKSGQFQSHDDDIPF